MGSQFVFHSSSGTFLFFHVLHSARRVFLCSSQVREFLDSHSAVGCRVLNSMAAGEVKEISSSRELHAKSSLELPHPGGGGGGPDVGT